MVERPSDQPASGKRRLGDNTAAEGFKHISAKKKNPNENNSSGSSQNQTKKERIPPLFIEPIKHWSNLLIILRHKVPSVRSIINKNYIRVSVDTEAEYRTVQ